MPIVAADLCVSRAHNRKIIRCVKLTIGEFLQFVLLTVRHGGHYYLKHHLQIIVLQSFGYQAIFPLSIHREKTREKERKKFLTTKPMNRYYKRVHIERKQVLLLLLQLLLLKTRTFELPMSIYVSMNVQKLVTRSK